MIQNKRDLGGMETSDGRRIKPGCLIRSAHLFQARESDLKGVSTIIDLRTPGERKQAEDQTWQREYLPIPVFDDVQAGISHEQGTGEQLLPDMAILYARVINECTDSFRNIVTTIMKHDFRSGAILWHCTEGKDRCGITTALILEALGVNQETIMEDYLKTNLVNMPKAISFYEQLIVTHGEKFAESVYKSYIADERYLKAAWDAMGESYISERLGIEEDTINRFRTAVLG